MNSNGDSGDNGDIGAGAKSALRKRLRQRRGALGEGAQARAADALAVQLCRLAAFRECRAVALYFAADGEIDPARALHWGLAQGKRCYAPVIVGGAKNELRFAEVNAQSEYRANRFGIAEPLADDSQLLDARDLDLALLPLVGFDRHGNRLGMGGGFYDTTFEYKKAEPEARPQLIGLAHDIQRVEKINAHHWDIPIDAVVTDRRIYHCAERADVDGCAAAAN